MFCVEIDQALVAEAQRGYPCNVRELVENETTCPV